MVNFNRKTEVDEMELIFVLAGVIAVVGYFFFAFRLMGSNSWGRMILNASMALACLGLGALVFFLLGHG